jgi:hypothetical protein
MFVKHPMRSSAFKRFHDLFVTALLLAVSRLSLVGSGCSIRNPQSATAGWPELKDIAAPDAVYLLSDSLLVVSVRVEDPQGIGDIASVRCFLIPQRLLPLRNSPLEQSQIRICG